MYTYVEALVLYYICLGARFRSFYSQHVVESKEIRRFLPSQKYHLLCFSKPHRNECLSQWLKTAVVNSQFLYFTANRYRGIPSSIFTGLLNIPMKKRVYKLSRRTANEQNETSFPFNFNFQCR